MWGQNFLSGAGGRRNNSPAEKLAVCCVQLAECACCRFLLPRAPRFSFPPSSNSSLRPLPCEWSPAWKSTWAPTPRVSEERSIIIRERINKVQTFKRCLCADSVAERRALGDKVFPAFRQHCRHTLGLDVRVSEWVRSGSCSPRWENCVAVMIHVVGGAALSDVLPRVPSAPCGWRGWTDRKQTASSVLLNESLLTSSWSQRREFCLSHSTKAGKKNKNQYDFRIFFKTTTKTAKKKKKALVNFFLQSVNLSRNWPPVLRKTNASQ